MSGTEASAGSGSSPPMQSSGSRLLLLTTPPSSSSTTLSTKVATLPMSSAVDEKIFSKYSNTLAAEASRKKAEIADHIKRLSDLRKEAENLEHTDWMYEPIDKLLGK